MFASNRNGLSYPESHLSFEEVFERLSLSEDPYPLGIAQLHASRPGLATEDDWLVYCMRTIYEHLCYVTECLCHVCSHSTCPRMCAGHLEFRWPCADGTSQSLSAIEYTRRLMFRLNEELQDRNLFPSGFISNLSNKEYFSIPDLLASFSDEDDLDHASSNSSPVNNPPVSPVQSPSRQNLTPKQVELRQKIHQMLRRICRVYCHALMYHANVFLQNNGLMAVNYCFRFLMCVFMQYFPEKFMSDMQPLSKIVYAIFDKENACSRILILHKSIFQQADDWFTQHYDSTLFSDCSNLFDSIENSFLSVSPHIKLKLAKYEQYKLQLDQLDNISRFNNSKVQTQFNNYKEKQINDIKNTVASIVDTDEWLFETSIKPVSQTYKNIAQSLLQKKESELAASNNNTSRTNSSNGNNVPLSRIFDTFSKRISNYSIGKKNANNVIQHSMQHQQPNNIQLPIFDVNETANEIRKIRKEQLEESHAKMDRIVQRLTRDANNYIAKHNSDDAVHDEFELHKQVLEEVKLKQWEAFNNFNKNQI